MKSKDLKSELLPKDAKKVFWKLGYCSRTFFYLLNREFDHSMELEERAAEPLAGGILQKGYQCGMLWGASLAAGAEAYRSCAHSSQAIAVAVEATKAMMNSFESLEGTSQCKDITHCDFNSKLSFTKYMVTGRFLHCFQLAEDWAPLAVAEAKKALAAKPYDFQNAMSCTSEVARIMGASEEEMVMVAGFAGGLGLSGNACGGLAAAVWMNALDWCKEHEKESATKDPMAKMRLNFFKLHSKDQFLCSEITGRQFSDLSEHTGYLKKGGCAALMESFNEI